MCNIGTGKSNTQDQAEDGMYTFYIRSDVPVKSNKYIYDCEAVITIGDGNIGRVFHYVNGKFDLHQRCYRMTDFQNILGKYFYYFFSTRFYDRAMKMTAKATVDSVRIEMISEMDILMPTEIDEQKNIADFFTQLDHLITLHQSKSFGHILEMIVSCTLSWEQRKLGETFIYLRNNTLSREELNDEDGFAQSIHYGDVLIKYGECLNVSKELLPYIDNKNIVNKFKKFYIQNGDVIIADTAEDETVGKCIEISGIVDHNIISGLHTIPLRPVNNFAHGYLGFYLNSNSYHNQLKPLMQGIKVTSISKNLLKITTLNYPSNIKEQKIIGSYFDSLNHLITLHQLEPFQLIFKAIAYRIIDYAKSKPPRRRKYTGLISFIKCYV